MHTLVILDPGHFHAGLVLRESHPVLSDQIYIYAEKGPDLDRFLAMAESFNRREKDPTRWKMHVYTGSNYLDRCIE